MSMRVEWIPSRIESRRQVDKSFPCPLFISTLYWEAKAPSQSREPLENWPPPRKTLHMHEVTKVSPSLSFKHTLYAYFTIVLESREMGGVTEPPFQLQLADHFALYSCGSASYKPLHLDKDSYRVLGHIKRRKIGTPQFIAATQREREWLSGNHSLKMREWMKYIMSNAQKEAFWGLWEGP